MIHLQSFVTHGGGLLVQASHLSDAESFLVKRQCVY